MEVSIPECDEVSSDKETLTWFHHFLSTLQAKIVVEAGTYYGHFACLAGCAVKPFGGHVYTADAIAYGWSSLLQINQLDNVTFVHGDFSKIAKLHPHIVGQVDVAFVDSGAPFAYRWEHDIRLRHYQLAKKWVRSGGFVITDDVKSDSWEGVETIRREAHQLFDTTRGLASWQKP